MSNKILKHSELLTNDSVSRTAHFNITSGAIRVTDPCYSTEVWCAGTLDNVLNGAWLGRAHNNIEQTNNPTPFQQFVGWINDAIQSRLQSKTKEDHLSVEDESKYRLSEDSINLIGIGELASIEQFEQLNPWFIRTDKVILLDEQSRPPKFERMLFWIVEQELFNYFDAVQYKKAYRGAPHLLEIAHESFGLQTNFDGYELVDIDVGVDSGQAGFFDLTEYTNVHKTKEEENQFYENICDQTLAGPYVGRNRLHDGFASTPYGVSSLTYYGDGSYSCYVKRNDQNQVIAAVILFAYHR